MVFVFFEGKNGKNKKTTQNCIEIFVIKKFKREYDECIFKKDYSLLKLFGNKVFNRRLKKKREIETENLKGLFLRFSMLNVYYSRQY